MAGPNGAEKTTFANEFLPVEAECLNFINADLIAQGISPFQPEKKAIESGRDYPKFKQVDILSKLYWLNSPYEKVNLFLGKP